LEKAEFKDLFVEFAVYGVMASLGLDGLIICAEAGRLDFLLGFEFDTLKKQFGDEVLQNSILCFTKTDQLKHEDKTPQSFQEWYVEHKDYLTKNFPTVKIVGMKLVYY